MDVLGCKIGGFMGLGGYTGVEMCVCVWCGWRRIFGSTKEYLIGYLEREEVSGYLEHDYVRGYLKHYEVSGYSEHD